MFTKYLVEFGQQPKVTPVGAIWAESDAEALAKAREIVKAGKENPDKVGVHLYRKIN